VKRRNSADPLVIVFVLIVLVILILVTLIVARPSPRPVLGLLDGLVGLLERLCLYLLAFVASPPAAIVVVIILIVVVILVVSLDRLRAGPVDC
jgi:hypothetical protein